MAKKRAKIFETRYFGLIIGFLVATLVAVLNYFTGIIDPLEIKITDAYFGLKNVNHSTSVQEGVTLSRKDSKVSEDIIIVGIDSKSLQKFGKWPFPRYRHANLIDSFARISNQEERERALMLDVFFNEPDKNVIDDAVLIESIRNSERVFLETALSRNPVSSDVDTENIERQMLLNRSTGTIKNIKGNWQDMPSYLGIEPPLKPYARATHGYGHANLLVDSDQVFRRQALIAKISIETDTIKLDDLKPGSAVNVSDFERLVWIDKEGYPHTVSDPMSEKDLEKLKAQMKASAPLKIEDLNGDGQPDASYYILRKYKDYFLPSITLSLALEYFNKKIDDIEIVLNEYIRIPYPLYWDQPSGSWVPYSIKISEDEYDKDGVLIKEGKRTVLNDIKIPINEAGEMLVNFMGPPSSATAEGTHTFLVRSYSSYADKAPGPDHTTWPKTKAVGNKILMVGPFAQGIAEDERPTALGLMYGVEIHANALNTILMSNFIRSAPAWINLVVLFALTLFIALLSSRVASLWSGLATIVAIAALFITDSLIFDSTSMVYAMVMPAIAIVLTFVSIVIYRAMTDERDKARIREMFGKYVSPKVVDQILEHPPELGGVDKDLTVLFSDIRSFTTLSENMSPQELVNHLNEYLTAMTDLILDYGGTLDKYVGDEVMCFWGAPVEQVDHATRACKCAIAQMAKLRLLNENWPPQKRINIGIGLNSGIMTVGNMGSPGRMNYTLMGDNVNLGARLEGTNKEYKTNIIISENTFGLVKGDAIVRELDNIRVKGKNKPVQIYELLDFESGIEPAPPVPEKKRRA
jgi:adenylate cyclase